MGKAKSSPRSKIILVLKANALSVIGWVVLLIVVATLLFGLKYVQTGWSKAVGFTTAGLDSSFADRINDLSFILLIAGCITGLAMIFPVFDLQAANRIGDSVEFSRRALTWFVMLIFIMWALYFQAVYRDGGTFLWAFGDGKSAVEFSHASGVDATPAQLDRLGPIFGAEIFSKAKAEQVADLKAAATNAKKLAGLQCVEGMVFLFLLIVWAFLGVVMNIYVSRLGTLSKEDRGSDAAHAAIELLAVCLLPVLLLPGLAAIGFVANLKIGIVSAFLAGFTSFVMWSPFFIAFVRLLQNAAPVVRPPFPRWEAANKSKSNH